jgi:hypothetical protein
MWTRLDGALSSVLSRDIPDRAGTGRLEHDPEKWTPVFRKDHAQIKEIERDDDSKKSHRALEKSPAGIAARVFFLSCNRSSEWYESNSNRHHRQRSEL